MRLIFADTAWDDYFFWQQSDKRLLERINRFIRKTQCEPDTGSASRDCSSMLCRAFARRITEEHRMVYKVEGDALLLAKLRYHY